MIWLLSRYNIEDQTEHDEQDRVADLGDSSKIKVGEMAVAIGNALGYGQSVTVGYISAKDREISESDELAAPVLPPLIRSRQFRPMQLSILVTVVVL